MRYTNGDFGADLKNSMQPAPAMVRKTNKREPRGKMNQSAARAKQMPNIKGKKMGGKGSKYC